MHYLGNDNFFFRCEKANQCKDYSHISLEVHIVYQNWKHQRRSYHRENYWHVLLGHIAFIAYASIHHGISVYKKKTSSNLLLEIKKIDRHRDKTNREISAGIQSQHILPKK